MERKPDRSRIPEAVAENVDRFVDTLDGLEILVFLSRHGERTWSASEIAATVGVPLPRAQRSLAHLCGVGLCANAAGDESSFRYAPRGPEELAAAEGILEAYHTRRVALINYVASEALNRIVALADAFRVKKGGADE